MSSRKVNILSGLGLTALSVIAVALAVAGCGKDSSMEVVETSTDSNFKVVNESFIGFRTVMEIVDKDTGVHYWYVGSSNGIAITPLYNADGSLKAEGGCGDE